MVAYWRRQDLNIRTSGLKHSLFISPPFLGTQVEEAVAADGEEQSCRVGAPRKASKTFRGTGRGKKAETIDALYFLCRRGKTEKETQKEGQSRGFLTWLITARFLVTSETSCLTLIYCYAPRQLSSPPLFTNPRQLSSPTANPPPTFPSSFHVVTINSLCFQIQKIL